MENIVYNLFKHDLQGYVKASEMDTEIAERIVDDLISTDTDKALSAKQGKKLKDSIDAIVASGGGDMLSVDYDEDRDGIIDRAKADKNGNDIAETYVSQSEKKQTDEKVDEKISELDQKTSELDEKITEHTHSATDIDSGILDVSYGGTGATTAEGALANLGITDLLANTSKIETGSYVGTGVYGDDTPNSLTFGFVPKLIFISAGQQSFLIEVFKLETEYSRYGYVEYSDSDSNLSYYAKAVDNTVYWYYGGTDSINANEQMNVSDTTYKYIALG